MAASSWADPCWVLVIKSLSSRNAISFLLTMHSITYRQYILCLPLTLVSLSVKRKLWKRICGGLLEPLCIFLRGLLGIHQDLWLSLSSFHKWLILHVSSISMLSIVVISLSRSVVLKNSPKHSYLKVLQYIVHSVSVWRLWSNSGPILYSSRRRFLCKFIKN